MQQHRRTFLKTCAIFISGLTPLPRILQTAGPGVTSAATPVQHGKRTVIIYQDRAHFDHTGVLEPYVPPVTHGTSTAQYVNRLGNREFLGRHWFV